MPIFSLAFQSGMFLLNVLFSNGVFVRMQITERKPQLAKLEAIDCGKPLDEAAWDMVMRSLIHLLY